MFDRLNMLNFEYPQGQTHKFFPYDYENLNHPRKIYDNSIRVPPFLGHTNRDTVTLSPVHIL